MVKATNRILDTGVKTRQKVRKTDRNHVNDYSSVMFMIRMPSNIDKIRHCTASSSLCGSFGMSVYWDDVQ